MLLGTPEVTAENQLAINRLDSAQENITIREQMMISSNSLRVRVRSQLEVRRLDQYDVGRYWCGIRIDSSEWMLLSDSLLLEQPSEYVGLEPCSTNVAQSKRERKCATWSFNAQPTTSPSVETPETTTLEEKSETASPPLEPNTTVKNIMSWPTSELTDERMTTSKPLKGDNEDLGLLLGVAIGVLVTFGVVIMSLTAVVVCMCIKIIRGT